MKNNESRLIELEIYVNELLNEQIQKVKRFQAIFLESIGFKIFTPRTGCMMCPFPVKHGYMQWMRLNHEKVYNAIKREIGWDKVILMIQPIKQQSIEVLIGSKMIDSNKKFLIHEGGVS